MWQQWINGILGLGIVAVPFLGLTTAQNTWTLAIAGLVIAALGFWGGAEHSTMEQRGMRHA